MDRASSAPVMQCAKLCAKLCVMLLLGGCGERAIVTGHTNTPAGGVGGSDTITVPPVSRDASAAFQTDSLTIHLVKGGTVYSGDIAATFTNPLRDTVFIVNCNGSNEVLLQRQVDTAWVTVWSPAIPACLSPPIAIHPTAQRRTGLYLFASQKGAAGGPFPIGTDTVPGIYRLEFEDYVSPPYSNTFPFGTPLPLSQRVSNRFRILVTW